MIDCSQKIIAKKGNWPLMDLLGLNENGSSQEVNRPRQEIWIAIAITPRCGSTAFCSILEKSGVLGRPAEILNPRGPAQWLIGDAKPVSLNQYFDLASKQINTGNVCTFKTSWGDFEPLLNSHFCANLLKRFSWIYIERRNLSLQALSLAKARKSGTWHRKKSDPTPMSDEPVTPEEISWAQNALQLEKDGWECFFNETKTVPHRFIYEDLLKDLHPSLKVLSDIAMLDAIPSVGWEDSKFLKLNSNS